MNELTTILFGTFVPPEVKETRRYRITGFSKFPRYIKPKITGRYSRNANGECGSEVKVLEALKEIGGTGTAHQVAELVGMTRNHCGIVLCALFKRGRTTRTKKSVGNTRFYEYTINGA